eukprot:CAMPEP_0177511600 /NCGR_PEP_ID=MMETSP0369-20130122/42763_1 /TAXON_ID=447022 ORGANISM="Scrippsiella hangoei-like, Strain SHHI-4" /NCGR_SAMPLE_ID=MMETSP0369 /ASSEMBLY_ACC=CAM_ASM_000364 /LENGTH=181 /DNA_ID=CAMNT_0018990021 /DNA_START=497 /DNA_END=1039 /DNA_ORIENTATION=-
MPTAVLDHMLTPRPRLAPCAHHVPVDIFRHDRLPVDTNLPRDGAAGAAVAQQPPRVARGATSRATEGRAAFGAEGSGVVAARNAGGTLAPLRSLGPLIFVLGAAVAAGDREKPPQEQRACATAPSVCPMQPLSCLGLSLRSVHHVAATAPSVCPMQPLSCLGLSLRSVHHVAATAPSVCPM